MARRVAVVDYGMGNLRSVQKALAHVAPDDSVEITSGSPDTTIERSGATWASAFATERRLPVP